MPELTDEETVIVATVRRFADEQVRPAARDLEQSDEYPGDLIERMKEMGIFGLVVPESFGGSKVSTPCFALVTEELARGWMSLAGAVGGHSVVCEIIARFGTPEQQSAYLPLLATGEMRAAMALTEPEGGSDMAGIRTVAKAVDDGYVLSGAKTWITNGRRAQLVAVLCKTDTSAIPAHSGISVMLVEQGHGIEVSRDLGKLGYKGVETSELQFSDVRLPSTPGRPTPASASCWSSSRTRVCRSARTCRSWATRGSRAARCSYPAFGCLLTRCLAAPPGMGSAR